MNREKVIKESSGGVYIFIDNDFDEAILGWTFDVGHNSHRVVYSIRVIVDTIVRQYLVDRSIAMKMFQDDYSWHWQGPATPVFVND